MRLYENKELFRQAISLCEQDFNIPPEIIEKDYYVTELLRSIAELLPDIIFKGGTSLSKCYGIIDRFSEDIDLNYDNHGEKITDGMRKRIKKNIVSAAETLNIQWLNEERTRSRRMFNRYEFKYQEGFSSAAIRPVLIVEMATAIESYPTESKKVKSYIYESLKQQNENDIINEFTLTPFNVNVQTLERTFIDKVFAICDYYLQDRVNEHSRHLYDLHQLLPVIDKGSDLKILVRDVRQSRSSSPVCLSAQEGIAVPQLLNEIIEKDVYKRDYSTVTQALLFNRDVVYEEAAASLKQIAALDIWE